MPTPSAEDQRPSARLTSLFPSGMSDGEVEREAQGRRGRKQAEKGREGEKERRTGRQFKIEQRDSPAVFDASLGKLSYDIQNFESLGDRAPLSLNRQSYG